MREDQEEVAVEEEEEEVAVVEEVAVEVMTETEEADQDQVIVMNIINQDTKEKVIEPITGKEEVTLRRDIRRVAIDIMTRDLEIEIMKVVTVVIDLEEEKMNMEIEEEAIEVQEEDQEVDQEEDQEVATMRRNGIEQ